MHIMFMDEVRFKYNKSKRRIVMALEAEGLTGLMNGYANIHLLPMFQKIAYGTRGFPWNSDICNNEFHIKKEYAQSPKNCMKRTF